MWILVSMEGGVLDPIPCRYRGMAVPRSVIAGLYVKTMSSFVRNCLPNWLHHFAFSQL